MMRTLTPSLVSQSASTRPVGPAPITKTSVCAICYTPIQLSRRPQERATHGGSDAVSRLVKARRAQDLDGSCASALFAEPAKAVAPPPTGVTPTLVEAARKEGKLSYYCALELNVAE